MNIHCRLVRDFAQCLLSQSGWKEVERSGVVVLVVGAIAMFAFDFRAFNNTHLSVVIAESPTPSICNSKL